MWLLKSFLPVDGLLIKVLGVLALVGALIAGYQLWHHNVDKAGYDRANKEWLARNQAADLKAAHELEMANNAVFDKQLKISKLNDEISKRYEESKNDKAKFDALRNSHANDTKRLRLAGATCTSDSTAENQDSTTASGSEKAGQCVLLPSTAATILDVARSSRDNVRQLNECIDLYNAAREVVNAD